MVTALIITAPTLRAWIAYDNSALRIAVATPRRRHIGATWRLLAIMTAAITARLLLILTMIASRSGRS